jgi:hypothetical protein
MDPLVISRQIMMWLFTTSNYVVATAVIRDG